MESRDVPLTEGGLPLPPSPAPDWALFLDVDGCLLDFAQHPSQVVVPVHLQRDIVRLSDLLGGALALVSGRSLESIDEMFGELRALPAAGMHGLERREPDGRRTFPPIAPQALDGVYAEARQLAMSHPGAIIERKGPNLALHWRAAPEARDALRAFAAAALRVLPDYRAQGGDMVLELRPGGSSPDKGTAVEGFMAQAPFRGRTPVFVGDDLTDEHAFSIVNACEGFSVLVGDRHPSAARWRLPNPAAVRDWLARATLGAHDGVHA
ncbi:Trehalose-6-phosphate phosphatase [Lysobacter dokdonensis DS-58]|uniref:Trehalose 6-phosphate phosphatase n=1 Tax=Lysobacter dokdonensis DS-58 TaxID=1300345 RepID=A0A0A2WK77_9GAMM|nr:trehalose-phosphatase [Lysobacter dokdonensis]KGQ20178.1 Trehalose-6-phosphate phosphatase [Lysobacter dokdonensis DS-58]